MSDQIINLVIIIIIIFAGILIFVTKPNMLGLSLSGGVTDDDRENKENIDDRDNHDNYVREYSNNDEYAYDNDSQSLSNDTLSISSINSADSIESIDDIVKIKKLDDKEIKEVLCSLKNDKKRCEDKLEFVDIKLHNDYFDTVTAINYLTNQKELFNLSIQPVKIIEPDKKTVKYLVKTLIDKINHEVKYNVPQYLNRNSGWNDQGKQRIEKSGFEEQQEALGLPGDLYTKPAGKAKIELIEIDETQQMMTDDDIRVSITIVVKKKNVKDRMIMRKRISLYEKKYCRIW